MNVKMEIEKKIAEFIGIMLGDGNIGIYKIKRGKLHQLKVTLDSRNKEYTDYVKDLMKEVIGIEPKIFYKKKENAVDIKIYRKEGVIYAIKDLGLKISPKWENAKIPDKYCKGKLGLLVLKGLFDTDGSITIFRNNGIIYPRIEIRISPSPMQQQFIDILNENGIRYTIQKLERGKIKLRISGEKELKKWFDKIGSSNQLYKERAKQFL